jgi:hypothetical protein
MHTYLYKYNNFTICHNITKPYLACRDVQNYTSSATLSFIYSVEYTLFPPFHVHLNPSAAILEYVQLITEDLFPPPQV